MKLNILCIGDIVGRPGRRIIAEKLKSLIAERDVDCVIANAENAAGGSGLTPQIYTKLLRYGVNLVTLRQPRIVVLWFATPVCDIIALAGI